MSRVLLPNLQTIHIAEIKIVNPRQRSTVVAASLTENIKTIGLKRPITVTRREVPEGSFNFDLVCGQGRLEAYMRLAMSDIPAVIIDVSSEDGLVMSLIENVARRHRSALETMMEIQALRSRGHTHQRIADMIGTTPSWVTGVLGLLERGEERLVASVASGVLPLGTAIRIATADSQELQRALGEAYESGDLRGKQLAMVRRVLKLREKSKALRTSGHGGPNAPGSGKHKWTPGELLRIYEEEAAARRLIVKKAALVQSLLVYTVEAFKQLLQDDQFIAALKAERLVSMPAPLAKMLAHASEVVA